MKKLIMLAAATLMAVMVSASYGEAAKDASKEAAIKTLLESNMKGMYAQDPKIESVTRMPDSNLYEVRVGGDIFYTDENAKYMIFGHVLDTKSKHDYTKARIDEINTIKFADLPFSYAAKMVKGNGKRKIAVFEDPNCGYCKHFRQTLQSMDNLTVYTFMYNILAPDSRDKSTRIWCAPDRAKAWDEWMVSGKLPGDPPAKCKAPNDEVLALGQKLRITGTPTIFFTDGSRIPGAVEKQGLEEKLSSIK